MRTVLATMDGQPIHLLADGDNPLDPDANASSEKQDANESGSDDGGGGGFFDSTFLFIIIGMAILWVFLIGGGSRKQRKKQAEMLATMSKGSKIVTIGGIRGSVVEVREDEVVVKVDENSNTRMKFSRDAIRTVLGEPSGKDAKDAKDDKAAKESKADKAVKASDED